MRSYETTWDVKEVNKLASRGYILHSVIPSNGLLYYVMEWIEPAKTLPYNPVGTTQFGDH